MPLEFVAWNSLVLDFSRITVTANIIIIIIVIIMTVITIEIVITQLLGLNEY